MKYPKPVMKKNELVVLGFPEEWLLMVYRTTKNIAWKMGHKNNSPILFDTEELDKYRKLQTGGFK